MVKLLLLLIETKCQRRRWSNVLFFIIISYVTSTNHLCSLRFSQYQLSINLNNLMIEGKTSKFIILPLQFKSELS